MKISEKLKKDNRGAALVLVLLVAALVSMLVALMLIATVTNAKLKSTEQIGNSNFNVADSAVEELTMGLEEIADQALREAYAYMLQVYSSTVQNQRLLLLQKRFADTIVARIKDLTEEGTNKVDLDKLQKMIVGASGGNVLTGNNDDNIPTFYVDTDYSVVIKDVKITYTDDNGYETIITTDIRFSIPANLVDVSKVSDSIDFKGFSIITDGSLIRDSSGNNFNVSGSIYAKNGINVKQAGLNMSGEYVISRGSLVAEDGGMITSGSQIWVRNIETKGSGSPINGAGKPWIDISGVCYVADDLSLNADWADVVISGNYYGYHTTNSTGIQTGDAAGSSAIVVNAANANLTLSGSTVLIAGKTYLSVPNFYYDTRLTEAQLASLGLGVASYTNFLQGESLSFKGVQSAYMVPGDCILGYNHNPLTIREFEELQDYIDHGSLTHRVYLGQNAKNGGIDLMNYVDSANPYRWVTVKYYGQNGNGTEMVYFYLNFTSPNKAADYFQEYYARYGVRVERLADYLNIGQLITSSNTSISSTGNLIINKNNVLNVVPRTHDYSDPAITKQEISYARKYNGLITYLDPFYYTNDTTKDACDLLIHFTTPTADCSGLIYQTEDYVEGCDERMIYDLDDGSHLNTDKHPFVLITPYSVDITESGNKVIITTKNAGVEKGIYTVSDTNAFEGLIVAAGSVTDTNASFNGMIIARQGVELKGNADLNNGEFYNSRDYHYYYRVDEDGTRIDDPESDYIHNVEDLIKHDQNIYKWFKTYIPSGVEDSNGVGENGVDITFENWTKNY